MRGSGLRLCCLQRNQLPGRAARQIPGSREMGVESGPTLVELSRAFLVGRRAHLLSGPGWTEASLQGRELQCWAMPVDRYRSSRMGESDNSSAHGPRHVLWLG